MALTKEQQAAADILDARFGALDEERQKFLRDCAAFPHERTSRYTTAEMYYDGLQETYLTDRLKTYLEYNNVPYSENYCEVVVDALVERLAVIGFTTGNPSLDDWLWTTWWDRNRGDELQLDVHETAAKYGDAYLFLEWDREKAVTCTHINKPDIISPHYEMGVLQYVAKVWNTEEVSPVNPLGEKVRRMNLYYPDRVEKWFTVTRGDSDTQMWGRWVDEGETTWPLDWTHEGKPIGIPIFHFANKARGDHMGRPEHWGTIPQQNRLNKELLDLSAVLDQQGWPQRYVTGLSNVTDLKSAPGEVWHTDAIDGEFGQFDAADPAGLLAAVQATLVRIATRSNTPAFRFILEGGYPSGESQKVAEAGLVAKSKARQTKWGGVWAAVAEMAAVIAIKFGGGSGAGPGVDLSTLMGLTINPTWADPESRNEKEHLETLQLMHALGVSKRTLLTMMPGIDAEQEMKAREAEDEADAERQATVMAGGMVPPQTGSTEPLG